MLPIVKIKNTKLWSVYSWLPDSRGETGIYRVSSVFYLMMAASGLDAQSSVLSCKGWIDLAIIFSDKVCIIEFKCNQSAQVALQQIHDKKYADMYRRSGKRIILMGINFNSETRNVAEWKAIKIED